MIIFAFTKKGLQLENCKPLITKNQSNSKKTTKYLTIEKLFAKIARQN